MRGLRGLHAVQESACGRRPTGCDGGLGLGTNSWVSHEALVFVLLHDEGKGTLELKTAGRLREVGDVGEVVVSEARAVDALGMLPASPLSAQNCKDAFVELVGAKPLDDGDAGERVLEGHDASVGPGCGGFKFCNEGSCEVDQRSGVSMMSDRRSSSSNFKLGRVSAMEPG